MDHARKTGLWQATGVGVFAALIGLAWSWQPSYWYDEAATLSAVGRSPAQLWDLLQTIDAVHGLYYLVMQQWVDVVGADEASTRSFSAIGIGLTAAGMSLIGQRLGGRSLGLAAGLISALLPSLAWAGTEARQYSWASAAAVLATALLLRALESDRRRDWAWYAVAIALATYVFLFCLLLLLAHLLTVLAMRGNLRRWSGSAVVSALLISPLLFQAWRQRGQVEWIDDGVVEMFAKVVLAHFLGPRAIQGVEVAAVFAVSLLILSCFLVLVAVRASPEDPAKMPVLAVGLPWAIAPTFLIVAYSLTLTPIYTMRYVIFSAPGLALVLGFGLLQLRSHRWIFVSACFLLVALCAPILVQQKSEVAKGEERYRQLAQFIGLEDTDIDAVILGRSTANGVRIAYPEDFSGVVLLNLGQDAIESDTLWGSIKPPQSLDPNVAEGLNVALVAESDEPLQRNRYARWLEDAGCQSGDSTWGRRFSVYVFEC